jgi:uncharacterized protein (DUF1810 family)
LSLNADCEAMAHDLSRFIGAQEGVHASALEELRAGRKRSHWMWFVFPQLAGLGRSEMSRHYAIASLEEARAYLADPVLGPRLRTCAQAILATNGRNAEEILGPIDAVKLRSSMTLFQRASGESIFAEVLDRFYGGVPDPETERLLAATAGE